MPHLQLNIDFETELLDDAVWDLVTISVALAKRHGEPFRALDRRLEALLDRVEAGELDWPDDVRWLDGGRGVLMVPPEIAGIIAEAKRLGVV